MPATLVPLVLQLVQLGITMAPSIIAAAQTEIGLVNSGVAPTAEQTAEINAAFEAAHTALQAQQQGAPVPLG